MKQGLKVVKRWLGSCKALDETNMSGWPYGGNRIAMIEDSMDLVLFQAKDAKALPDGPGSRLSKR